MYLIEKNEIKETIIFVSSHQTDIIDYRLKLKFLTYIKPKELQINERMCNQCFSIERLVCHTKLSFQIDEFANNRVILENNICMYNIDAIIQAKQLTNV